MGMQAECKRIRTTPDLLDHRPGQDAICAPDWDILEFDLDQQDAYTDRFYRRTTKPPSILAAAREMSGTESANVLLGRRANSWTFKN